MRTQGQMLSVLYLSLRLKLLSAAAEQVRPWCVVLCDIIDMRMDKKMWPWQRACPDQLHLSMLQVPSWLPLSCQHIPGPATPHAGREAPGKAFRLYTEASHAALAAERTPEILRANLATVALQLKALGVDNVLQFPFMDAPPVVAIARALELLLALGALDKQVRGAEAFGCMLRADAGLASFIGAAKHLKHGLPGGLQMLSAPGMLSRCLDQWHLPGRKVPCRLL